MNELPRYTMVIEWSDEDNAYLVSFPEWDGRVFNPITHGGSYVEAARNGTEALVGLVGSARRHAEPMPEIQASRAAVVPD